MKGFFITFEGMEGCGKSTQIERLRQHLEQQGHHVDVMREPGGTPISEAIRAILLDPANSAMANTTELLLYESARAQLVAERIRPALDAGTVVLCDRFCDSTLAYQGGGRGLPVEVLRSLHDIATGALWPHLTLFLDVPVEMGLQRTRGAGELDRIELEDTEFHGRVRDAFIALAEAEPERIVTINGTGAADTVEEAVRAVVDKALAAR